MRGRLTKTAASCCIARLLVLAAEGPALPIITYVDSPGGNTSEALGIISTMDGIRCPIVTFCSGAVSGPALAIATHGLRGFRVAAPTARFSFKEFDPQNPMQKTTGYGSLLSLLAQSIAADSRRSLAEVLQWFKSGVHFNSQEALRNGLIDLVSTKPMLPKP